MAKSPDKIKAQLEAAKARQQKLEAELAAAQSKSKTKRSREIKRGIKVLTAAIPVLEIEAPDVARSVQTVLAKLQTE